MIHHRKPIPLRKNRKRSVSFEPPAPFISHSGPVGSVSVRIVTHGKDQTTSADNIGTVPAALAAFLSIQTFQPDLVINAGTAGGFVSQVMNLLKTVFYCV